MIYIKINFRIDLNQNYKYQKFYLNTFFSSDSALKILLGGINIDNIEGDTVLTIRVLKIRSKIPQDSLVMSHKLWLKKSKLWLSAIFCYLSFLISRTP